VRLSADGWSKTQPLVLKIDPRLAKDGVTQADLEEQLALNLKIRDAMGEARRLVQQIDEALKDSKGEAGRLREIRAKLVTASGPYPQPMLIDQLGNLNRMVSGGDRKVGRSAFEFFEVIKKEMADLEAEINRALSN